MGQEHNIFEFPQEILDAIIDQVGIEAQESEYFDTLRKCTLTSRSLLPSSRKWLWEDLSFTLVTFEPDQGELLASLCCFPMEIHKYVKKSFLYYYDCSDLGENYSRYRLYHMLGYFRNLQEFSVKFRQDPVCQKTKLEKLSHKNHPLNLFLSSKLTTLSLTNVSNVPISMFQILPQTLKRMTLKSIAICDDTGSRIVTLREQLKRNRQDFVFLEYLEIATTLYNVPGVWDSVLSPGTLERLRFCLCTIDPLAKQLKAMSFKLKSNREI
ncbi:hypothetical protein BDQ12DRAFT_467468 [Crucibulum laeve]|uniref:Uncharacterized protein n=1 Tax=Crucibulum laeve TaxID=68775 RepID=A0A5C3M622_9AGAR|nr:hypothetical protein BDQ12DRAFT_467468 [Crucibulum laeve]